LAWHVAIAVRSPCASAGRGTGPLKSGALALQTLKPATHWKNG
jgi:hypothetical protein